MLDGDKIASLVAMHIKEEFNTLGTDCGLRCLFILWKQAHDKQHRSSTNCLCKRRIYSIHH
jgi:hypothetical protein